MEKIYYEADPETGELTLVEGTPVFLGQGDQVITKKQSEVARIIKIAKNENGPFVWLLFKYGKDLFPNLSAANFARLMYAATFCDKNGIIMNKKELIKKMKLNRTRWAEFWTEATDNNILYEKNDVVYANVEVFQNGCISTDENYIRLFCEYIQRLYEQCESTTMHKQLAYIFKIIPYVNRRTNAVCFNPEEQNERDIKYMSLGDFCDAIGYERKNARRLVKDLLKIRINDELAIGFFVGNLEEDTWIMVVNPRLYFGGRYDFFFQRSRNLFVEESMQYKLTLTQQND